MHHFKGELHPQTYIEHVLYWWNSEEEESEEGDNPFLQPLSESEESENEEPQRQPQQQQQPIEDVAKQESDNANTSGDMT